jgi:hypothetical protein
MTGTSLECLSGLPKFKEIVTVAWGHAKFDEHSKRGLYTKATLPRGARIGKRYARFAPANCIGSHAVDWRDCYVDADLYSRERKSQFSRPKLVFAGTSPRLRVAYDDQSLYLGRSLFSTGCRAAVSLPYLAGVLNSLLLNSLFRDNGSNDPRKPCRLEAEQLARLPILVPEGEMRRKVAGFIEANVLRLIHAKQSRRILGEVWGDVAGFHAQRFGTMSQLLANHLPGQKDAWVRRLMPSLATLNRRSRKFQQVRLHSEKDAPILRIYGHTDSGEEVVLAEAEFADRALMLYACLSASVELKRRTRPATVRKIMEEARVPLAGDNLTEGAHRIISQLFAKAPKAFAEEGVPAVQVDVARIDHEIQKLEAMIDAEVFRLHDLAWEPALAVTRLMHATNLETRRIETFFQNVSESTSGEPNPPSAETPTPAA